MSYRGSAKFELETIGTFEKALREVKANLPHDAVVALANEVVAQVVRIAPDRIGDGPSHTEIARLSRALISDEPTAGAEFIEAVRAKGVATEDVYLKYLAAAARMLGDWWTEDRVSFVEVTIGTSRIYGIMRGLRRTFRRPRSFSVASAVFAAVPGETHTLGVTMAADLFRSDGWQVNLNVGMDHDALVESIESLDCELIGLSVGGQHSMSALARLVVALHICLPATPILVAGPSAVDLRRLIDLMGVDAVVGTLEEARAAADDLVSGQVPKPQ